MEQNPEEEAATINIGNINGGDVIGQFDHALQRVLENIADLSTVATATRSITLEVVIKPHSDRVKIETEVHVKCRLGGAESSKGLMFMAKSEGGGMVAIDEDPRQMPLWKVAKPVETPVIKFRTGDK